MKSLTTVLFLVFTCSLIAQDEYGSSIIYTNSGGVYVGKVVKEDAFTIKMVIETGDTISIDKRYVKKQKKPARLQNVILLDKGKYHKKEGLFLSLDYSIASSSEENTCLLFAVIAGYRLNSKWSVGVSIAAHHNSVSLPGNVWADHQFSSIAAYGRYNITNKKIRWFAESSLGYGKAKAERWLDQYSDGVYFRPGIGFVIANRKRTKWSFKISHYIQSTSGTSNFGNWNPGQQDAIYTYKQLYNRTMIGIGVNL